MENFVGKGVGLGIRGPNLGLGCWGFYAMNSFTNIRKFFIDTLSLSSADFFGLDVAEKISNQDCCISWRILMRVLANENGCKRDTVTFIHGPFFSSYE